MKEWIMSIVGAIVLTILIEVLMSDGEMKKYVKGITSLIVLAIIISPLPNLFSKESIYQNFDVNMVVDEVGDDINYTFLEETKQKQMENLNQACLILLNEKGITNVIITPTCANEDNEFEMEKILIDCTNLVIKEGFENIDIKDTIISIVTSVYKVKNDIVEVIEWYKKLKKAT